MFYETQFPSNRSADIFNMSRPGEVASNCHTEVLKVLVKLRGALLIV